MASGFSTLFAMTSPLQTVRDAACKGATLPSIRRKTPSRIKERLCMAGLFLRELRRERLQPFHPQNGHLVLLRFEHRDRRVRAYRGIDPRLENLSQILRLISWRFLPHDEEGADGKDGERSCSGPDQSADRPPGRPCAGRVAFSRRWFVVRDPLAQLMIEE